VICLGYGAWGAPGSRGWVGMFKLVLTTFPELIVEVCAKFGGDWYAGSHMKEGHTETYIGTNSFYIYI